MNAFGLSRQQALLRCRCMRCHRNLEVAPALGGCACDPSERDKPEGVAFFAGLLSAVAFFLAGVATILLFL